MSAEDFKNRERTRRTEERDTSNLNELVKKGEWMKLKDNQEFQSLSLEGRISFATDTINVRIKQMEKVFAQVLVQNPREAGVILDNAIKPMRVLNQALGLRLAGEYEKGDVREAVNDVLGIHQGMPKHSHKKVA